MTLHLAADDPTVVDILSRHVRRKRKSGDQHQSAADGIAFVAVTLPAANGNATTYLRVQVVDASQGAHITGITPVSGSTAGGMGVAITADNLADACTVSFGKAAAIITATTASSIIVQSPACATRAENVHHRPGAFSTHKRASMP